MSYAFVESSQIESIIMNNTTVPELVYKWSEMYCEALKHSYIQHSIKMHNRSIYYADAGDIASVRYHEQCIDKLKNGESDYSYEIEKGKKYLKIMMVIDNGPNRLGASRSVHAFIDKNTGEVYKAASWRGPARNGVRFDLRLIESRERLYECCDWAGGHLYK